VQGPSVRIPAIADRDSNRLRTAILIDCGQHSDDCGRQLPVDGFMGSRANLRVKLATLAGVFYRGAVAE
jgi:hypothetical protein